MDNKKVVVSDEELKEVTGGLNLKIENSSCAEIMTEQECLQAAGCKWVDNKRCSL